MKSFNPIEIMMAAERAQSIFIFVLCMVTLLCIVIYRDARKERKENKRRVR